MNAPLMGIKRPARYLAAQIDHLLSIGCAVATGAAAGEFVTHKSSDAFEGMLALSVPIVFLLYFFVFEWLVGATPGKLISGLRVRKLDGSRCGARSAFIRTVFRLFEANPLLLGGLPAAVIISASKSGQRVGDRIAGTVVVVA